MSCDPHQVRLTQGTLSSGCPVRKTRAKMQTDCTLGSGKTRREEISEEYATTLSSVPYDRSTGHLERRDDNPPAPPHNAMRSVEVNSSDSIVPRSGLVKATASTASTATEAMARRHNIVGLITDNYSI